MREHEDKTMKITPAFIARQLDAQGVRYDANETAVFARSLEHISATIYEVKYPELKATSLIPVNAAVDPGAEFYTWRLFDRAGAAKRLVNYADDFPRVDVQASENVTPIASYGDAYGYSMQDIRRAALAGVDLDTRRAMAAREALARKIDLVAAFGDDEANIPGFLRDSNVPVVAQDFGAWDAAARTGAEILTDLQKLERSIVLLTNDLEQPDTLLVPPSLMAIIATKPASALVPTVSVLEYFLQKSRYVKNVESWYHLETGDVAGTGQRIVMYKRDPTKVELVLPVEFEQLPPQARNMAFVVNCHARTGGVVFHYPKSAAFMDNC